MKTNLPSILSWLKTIWIWLREAVINIFKLIISFGLIILAVFLTALAILVSAGWYLATIRSKRKKAREIMSATAVFNFLISLCIDHFGNVACGGFFNWLFLKKESSFPFGVPGESVSEILGWNYEIDNLSEWGLNLRHDLNIIDNDHCEKAMMKALFSAKNLIDRYKAIQTRIDTIERTREFLAKYN